MIVTNESPNTGRLLENFVFLELIKKGFTVYTAKVGRDCEIDFFAMKGNKKMYIQVSESIIDEKTRERETRPFIMFLINIRDI